MITYSTYEASKWKSVALSGRDVNVEGLTRKFDIMPFTIKLRLQKLFVFQLEAYICWHYEGRAKDCVTSLI